MKKYSCGLPIASNKAIALLASILVLLSLLFALPSLPIGATAEERIFQQVWETVNQNFYDPKFNGIDWQQMGEKYRPLAEKANSRPELAAIINQMLSELKTSHTRFYTPAEPEYYQLLGIFYDRSPRLREQLKRFFPSGKIEYTGIGAFTKTSDGNIYVSSILDGTPAAKAGLQIGDRLVAADGERYRPIDSFVGKAGKTVKLSIVRESDRNARLEIAVTPETFDATTMFLNAQKASREIANKEGKTVGYVHVWSYAGDRYQKQLENDLTDGFFKEVDRLVLDLRDGWGGASPGYLNLFTARTPDLTTIGRDGRRIRRNFQWKKPVVMLVNEGTRSGKEILAFGFQRYQIGPVVGSKTAGAVVGGSSFLMRDGSLLYLAVVDVLVDNKYRLEGEGIVPDIAVPFSLKSASGVDLQKQRAIEIASTLNKN